MRIATLTGGGDTQSLNPTLRAIVKYACRHFDDEVLGIREGWKGLVNELVPEDERIPEGEPCIVELTPRDVSGILTKGGTILGASRTNPFKLKNGFRVLRQNFEKLDTDALIVIGGEDTLGVAYDLFLKYGFPIVGIPKTIDRDLHQTDVTLGFSTACDRATEVIDAVHTTAESHNRILIVEVMGRHAGWIAVESGMAGGADAILIPEFPMTINEVCEIIDNRRKEGKRYSIVVVSEGYKIDDKFVTQSGEKDAFGHEKLGRVGERLGAILEEEIRKRTGFKFEVKVNRVGDFQRGGTPNREDRTLATRLGKHAVDLAHNHQFGRMVAVRGYDIVDVELREAVGADAGGKRKERKIKTIPRELWETAKVYFD